MQVSSLTSLFQLLTTLYASFSNFLNKKILQPLGVHSLYFVQDINNFSWHVGTLIIIDFLPKPWDIGVKDIKKMLDEKF